MQVMADILGLSPAQVGATVGLAGLLYAVIRWRQNTLRRRATLRQPPPQTFTSSLNVREVTTEIAALLGEVEETARRLTAQLDNRHMRLEQLVAEADEKIRRLEQLTSAGAIAAPSAAIMPEAQRALSRLRHERGAPPAANDPAYQPIYSLSDRGKSSREIAQELGRQPGEIELILALRQQV
jgi:hypothetical protein